ncbi:hypothetical protein [Streptomyces marincola]|uniref:hypothetical protein n=1 Tax=Streptomyces marincola TaxID=2878388 RepID=UPI001CF2ECB8|nr:hypothetical protein [Streptomyces marincola]UCM88015.1 hypothetical protein LC193_08625 [Streptomyces marincola]
MNASNVRLRQLREAQGRTQEEIVEALCEFADRLYVDGVIRRTWSVTVRQYRKWEGADPPWPRGRDAREVLQRFFGRSLGDLGFVYRSAAPPHDTPPEENVPTPSWIARPSRIPTGAGPMRVGAEEVHILRATAQDLDAIDQRFGGDRLRNSARGHLRWLQHMIDQGDYDPRTGRELHRIAGSMTVSLGWFNYDAGEVAEARAYFSEGLNTALLIEDTSLAIRTLTVMARQAVDLGRGRDAVRFARQGQQQTRTWHATPRVHALLAVREAQGHAREGDARACEDALRRAWKHWERGTRDDDPDWTRFLNRAEMLCLEGMCRIDLGQPARAQRLLATSAEHQLDAHNRNRGMCLGRLGVAALHARDVDHSVDATRRALTLFSAGMTSTRNMRQLIAIRTGLAHYATVRGVPDVLEQITDFMHVRKDGTDGLAAPAV